MRTTIELDHEHRARLLEMAARRGEKGFSAIVREALDLFFSKAAARSRPDAALRRFRGCLSKGDADHFRGIAGRLRDSWR